MEARPARTLDTFEEMMASRKLGETAALGFRPDMGAVPRHVLAAKQVLTFEAYFKEAVVESSTESFRIRRVVFKYYVEDDTCQVIEMRVENSGMDQGPFIKRHALPKAGGGFLHWTDFRIGEDVLVYGRAFRVTAVDDFTRTFCSDHGAELGANQEAPKDSYTSLRETIKARETGADQTGFYGKKANPLKRFMEATLGNPSAVQIRGIKDGKGKFLEKDRAVLRFFGVWDDRSRVYGAKLRFNVHYFLADDTVEVLEVHAPNSGRDKWPALLKRQPLSRSVLITDDRTRGIEDDNGYDDYYTEDDFVVGATIKVLGREVLLYDADESTHRWSIEERGIDMHPSVIDISEPAAAPLTVPAPPSTGYGTEEDSLGSVYHLVPKVPKKDVAKLVKYADVVLRFEAVIKDASPVDRVRKFTVSWFPENDTVAVNEPPQKNTGIIGGKFMAREKVLNPDTGHYFTTADFSVGGEVTLRGQRFILQAADPRTLAFLASESA